MPRQSARPKKSKQRARNRRPQRTALVNLRYRQIKLLPLSHHKDKEPITLWAVHALETAPPADTEPIEWFLLTTCEIATVEQAQECLRWYCLRWRIEDWRRVWKSGCNIEDMRHKTAERLKRVIAINMVIARRIMLMTPLGRECPGLPADLLFSDFEIEVLEAYAKKKYPGPDCLGNAVRLVACLGGCVGRAKDPHQIMWQGYSQLQTLCEDYSLREWHSG